MQPVDISTQDAPFPTWRPSLPRRIVDRTGATLLGPPLGGFGFVHRHGDRSVPKVALTFDDGPGSPSTADLLDVLDGSGTAATFFCVGYQVREQPSLVRRIHESGHDVGCHSMVHQRAHALSPFGASHIDASVAAVFDAIGRRPRLYRPPWGWLTPWEFVRLRRRGMDVVAWDIETSDSAVPEVPAKVLVDEVMNRVRPGSIIVFHDAYAMLPDCSKSQTAIAVDRLIPALRAQGYDMVTVGELVGTAAYADSSPLTPT